MAWSAGCASRNASGRGSRDRERHLRGHRAPPPARRAPARVPVPPRPSRTGTPPASPPPPRALASVDLDERPPRGRLVRFERSDYLGDPRIPLDEAVRALVAERTGNRPAGPIRVLTQLRSFGYCFNPVSFYYCFDEAGERVQTVVAEVTNTPWGERHAYVVERRGPGILKGDSEKVLHVSPFMGMDHRYDWRVA